MQATQLSIHQSQLASLDAGSDVIARDVDKTLQTFISDNAQRLGDSERQIEDFEQRLAKADARVEHLTLRAPLAGVVQASAITTVGQVVTTGQEVMRVVPENTGLEIEVYVLNKDIGFVQVGQEAVIKIGSFPFTRYGAVTAHVSRIARDAVPEPDASITSSRATRRAAPTQRPSRGRSARKIWYSPSRSNPMRQASTFTACLSALVRHGGHRRIQDRRPASCSNMSFRQSSKLAPGDARN